MTIKDLRNTYFGLVDIRTNYEYFYTGEMTTVPTELLNKEIYCIRNSVPAPGNKYIPIEIFVYEDDEV